MAAACTSCRAASGLATAKELIFTGRKVEADEALALGIADRMTAAPDTLLADALAWARRTLAGLRDRAGAEQDHPEPELRADRRTQVFAQGSQAQGICYTSTEHRESVMAFLAKATAASRQD